MQGLGILGLGFGAYGIKFGFFPFFWFEAQIVGYAGGSGLRALGT